MRRDQTDDKNVISLTRFVDNERFPHLSEVEAYWDGLRGDRLVPARSDIDPRGIERALEYAFILERVAPGVARLRIAGSHLTDLMGMEVRGMPITAFFTPESRKQMTQVLEQVFGTDSGTPQIAELSLEADKGIGKPGMEARMLLLPMASDMGDTSRILGCFVTRGQIGRCPRRFTVSGSKLRAIPQRSVAPAAPAPAKPQGSDLLRGLSETQAPYGADRTPRAVRETGSDKSAAERIENKKAKLPPYLRLVHSD